MNYQTKEKTCKYTLLVFPPPQHSPLLRLFSTLWSLRSCDSPRGFSLWFCVFVLSSVPHSSNLGVPHLPLQLENTIHQRLGSRRATRHINVDRDDTVAATDDAVAVVVVAAAVGAGAHGDDPAGLGHLVVDLAQGGSHLVGEGAGYDHDIGLAGGGAENDSQAILVVAGGGEVHHFDGAAGEAKGHGPEGGLAGPVGDDVEGCPALQVSLATS